MAEVDAYPPVNPQITAAVRASSDFVFGRQKGFGQEAGTGIAYQKAAQAAALSVQDAADYQRNVMSISTVAQGKALAMMFVDKENIPQYQTIFNLAMAAPGLAATAAGLVNNAATAMLNSFPKS
jgi:hypothetical protein